LREVFDAVLAATWKAPHGDGYEQQIAIVVDNVALFHLMSLAANEQATDEVRAIASLELHKLKEWLAQQSSAAASAANTNFAQQAHYFYAAQQIEQFEKNPKQITVPAPPPPPDGSPIGSAFDE
jgi:hypothetical protein